MVLAGSCSNKGASTDETGNQKETSLRSEISEEKRENDGHHTHSCRNLKFKKQLQM